MKDKITQIFKVLSCKNRIDILKILSNGKKCLCELAEGFDIDISTLSRHVSELVRLGLLGVEKIGAKKYLSIADPRILGVIESVEEIIKDVKE